MFYFPSFQFFWIFDYDFIMYVYFTYAATAYTITDNVTKLVMQNVFNTNLLYSGTYFTHIFDKNVDYLASFNTI